MPRELLQTSRDSSRPVGNELQQIHACDDAHRIAPLCHYQPVNMMVDHDSCDLGQGGGHRHFVNDWGHDVSDRDRPLLHVTLAQILECDADVVIAID